MSSSHRQFGPTGGGHDRFEKKEPTLTGPEHFLRAEQYLERAVEPGADAVATKQYRELALAHATLAHAAATAMIGAGTVREGATWMQAADRQAWREVAQTAN